MPSARVADVALIGCPPDSARDRCAVISCLRGVLVLRSLFASVVLVVAGVARAGDAPVGADGLAPGTAAPQFQLPVVNDFVPPKQPTGPLAPRSLKWGPSRWTGDKADDAKKLVVMSFFATYCEPCKKEMPELARLYETYKDQGLGVMSVSIDKGDEQKDEILAIAKASGVRFPVLHDRFQVVARRYGAERLPYMLLLDAAGVVKVVHIGYTEELKAGLEGELRQHLGLAPLPPPAPGPQAGAAGTASPAGKVQGKTQGKSQGKGPGIPQGKGPGVPQGSPQASPPATRTTEPAKNPPPPPAPAKG
jgi:thiol-disulfide isomerase/thioredoxin